MRMDRRGGSTVDRLLDTARRNPEGMLLLAAGAALLLRGANAAAEALRHYGPEDDESLVHGARAYASDMADRVGRSAGEVAGRVARTAESVAERVSHSAEAAADRASDMAGRARGAVRHSARFAGDTGSTMKGAMDRILDEQPLAVALFGVAAGAIFASAFPATSVERSTLAPLGRRLKDTAREAETRVKRSAKRARRQAKEIADEHGLNAAGLREAAREMGEAVSEELTTPARRSKSGRSRKAASAAVVEQPDPVAGSKPRAEGGADKAGSAGNGHARRDEERSASERAN